MLASAKRSLCGTSLVLKMLEEGISLQTVWTVNWTSNLHCAYGHVSTVLIDLKKWEQSFRKCLILCLKPNKKFRETMSCVNFACVCIEREEQSCSVNYRRGGCCVAHKVTQRLVKLLEAVSAGGFRESRLSEAKKSHSKEEERRETVKRKRGEKL